MSIHEISLKWNGFHSNIINKVKSLYLEEQTSDVTLIVQGLNLKAHKVVLSANSGVFKNIFEQNPHKDPIIVLHDIDGEALKKLLDFMYHGEVNVSEEFLPTLLKVADALKICGLSSGITFDGLETSPLPKKRKSFDEDVDKSVKSHINLNNVFSLENSIIIPKLELTEPMCCEVPCEPNLDSDVTIIDKLPKSLDTISIDTTSSEDKEERNLHKWIRDVINTQPLVIDECKEKEKCDAVEKDTPITEKEKDNNSQDSTVEEIEKSPFYASPSFPCPFCPRVYNSWGYRRRHVKSRHITTKLSCKWCVSVHSSQASWFAHATKAHGVSPEEARNGLVVMVEAHAVLTPPAAEPSVADLLGQVDVTMPGET